MFYVMKTGSNAERPESLFTTTQEMFNCRRLPSTGTNSWLVGSVQYRTSLYVSRIRKDFLPGLADFVFAYLGQDTA